MAILTLTDEDGDEMEVTNSDGAYPTSSLRFESRGYAAEKCDSCTVVVLPLSEIVAMRDFLSSHIEKQ